MYFYYTKYTNYKAESNKLWEEREMKKIQTKNKKQICMMYRDNKLILTKKHTLWFRHKWKEIYHKLKQPELIYRNKN